MSGYIEVFLLIGVAVGGSGLVYAGASGYLSSSEGASVSVAEASISQGAYFAMERVAVYNTGQTPISSFTISTEPVAGSAGYCYTLVAAGSMNQVSSTCPPSSGDPGRIAVVYGLPSGKGVIVEVTVMGSAFAVGGAEAVTVTTSSGPQASLSVQVGPA